MEKQLVVGRTYAVTTSSTCNVTDANGTLITTATAGQQVVFVAPTTTVSFSDDSASVVAVFKLALAKTRLFEQLGGGRPLIPALFLESTGAQNIKLTDTVDRDTGLMATYQTGEGACWATDGYFCTEKYNAITLPYRGSWGESSQNNWFWRWYTYTFSDLPVPGVDYQPNNYTKRLTGAANWKVSRAADIQFEGASSHKVKDYYDEFVETYTGLTLCVGFYKTFSVKVSQLQNVTRDMVPAIAPTGEPCLYDKVTRQSFYNSGTGSFIVGLTVEQARKMGKLPADATTKTLTISLPQSAFVDVETGEIADAAVNAALAQAEAKGWIITIQTY